ncbi:MAG: hypothetical protein IJ584_13380 [Bacteroidales bacterium]|nr:hypothetical protein [Bacteroidales bacterium]
MKKLALLIALVLPVLFSCSKSEPEFLKGEALGIYVGGQRYASTIVIGTKSVFTFGFDIVGGTSNKHSVTVADESVLTCSYTKPGVTHWDGYNYVEYAQVFIYPKKEGVTTVTVTDTESGEKTVVGIEVRKSNFVFPVKTSKWSEIPDGNVGYLWFTKDSSDPKIYLMDKDHNTFSVWKYKFINYRADLSKTGMYLHMEKILGVMGTPLEEDGAVVKEWKVMYNQNGTVVSAEDAIITLFDDLKMIETKADEVYNYLLVDPETGETVVELDLPSEDYLDL